MKWLKQLSAITVLAVLVSVLSGNAIWYWLGLKEGLDKHGVAKLNSAPRQSEFDSWQRYGGDAGGNRYSSAAQITQSNINQLEPVWTYQTGAFKGRERARELSAFESTPILINDQLILCSPFNDVIAIRPDSGEEIWRFDAKIDIDSLPAIGYKCRGVAYWQDDQSEHDAFCAERVFMGTADSRLVAVDVRTGRSCSDFGENGQVKLDVGMPLRWPGEHQITSAPVVVDDVVITGSAISDNIRTDAPKGTVFAYHARTGQKLWQFNPVPQTPDDPQFVNWQEGAPARTGHANVWSSMSVDESRAWVFLPTSSPSPDYFGGNRLGDNRYANSLVVLDAKTGQVQWHFQAVHHDVWDYDLPAQPGLHSVWRDGELHDVVAITTKMGTVFVLDRQTGEPFLPIEEVPVPQDAVPGEKLSLTQPMPVVTPPIVPSRLDPKDAFGITYFDKKQCERELAKLRADGLFTPPTIEGTLAYPFTGGGANWGSHAFDPTRNLLITNMNSIAQYMRVTPRDQENDNRLDVIVNVSEAEEWSPMQGSPYTMQRGVVISPLGLPCSPPPWGVLAAVDLSTGELVWRRALGTTQDLALGGLALPLGTPSFGGPIITASGVGFIGATMDNYLRAFDVSNRKELWKGRLPAGGQATPMTYIYEGRQYVVIAAGGHGQSGTKKGDYVIAFALAE